MTRSNETENRGISLLEFEKLPSPETSHRWTMVILTRNGSHARCPRRSPTTDPPSVDVVMADFVQTTTKRATRKKSEGHGW
ncbi:hypothetical protein V6N13_114495 [Hibiscus sabdariffa]